MENLRFQILSSADDLEDGANLSKEKFQHLMDANTKYHNLIEKHGFDNGYLEARYEYIMKKFNEKYQNK